VFGMSVREAMQSGRHAKSETEHLLNNTVTISSARPCRGSSAARVKAVHSPHTHNSRSYRSCQRVEPKCDGRQMDRLVFTTCLGLASMILRGTSVRGDSHRSGFAPLFILDCNTVAVFTGPACIIASTIYQFCLLEIIRVSVYLQSTATCIGHYQRIGDTGMFTSLRNAFRPQGSLPHFTVTPLSVRSLTKPPWRTFFFLPAV
jgi:hypothetical protein